MGWSIGYDDNWKRDIGYGVPAICDHPDCNEKIDRGLAYVCGSEPYGGDEGCGLFFCGKHMLFGKEHQVCERCKKRRKPFEPKPDTKPWLKWKLKHPSWRQWREENPQAVAEIKKALGVKYA